MSIWGFVRAVALVGSLALGATPASAESYTIVTATLTAATGNDPTAAAAAREATTESRSFNLQPGRPRWKEGPVVEYRIVGPPFEGAAAAVRRAEQTLDRFITTRRFARAQATTQINPCTGQPNTVRWAPLNGPGGTLAVSNLCLGPKSEIAGFDVTLDSLDGWSDGNDGNPNTYDVQAVVTHEFGHVAGLDHVERPRDACLTMYPFTGPEDTQQRTLGWGDKIGLDRVYDTGDTTPGPGCGA